MDYSNKIPNTLYYIQQHMNTFLKKTENWNTKQIYMNLKKFEITHWILFENIAVKINIKNIKN